MTPGNWGAQGYDQGPAGEVRQNKVRLAGDLSHSQVHAPRVATKLGGRGGGKREGDKRGRREEERKRRKGRKTSLFVLSGFQVVT